MGAAQDGFSSGSEGHRWRWSGEYWNVDIIVFKFVDIICRYYLCCDCAKFKLVEIRIDNSFTVANKKYQPPRISFTLKNTTSKLINQQLIRKNSSWSGESGAQQYGGEFLGG